MFEIARVKCIEKKMWKRGEMAHYAPTSKKFEGHIASGTFVRHVLVHPSASTLCFLMHSITSEPCMLGF